MQNDQQLFEKKAQLKGRIVLILMLTFFIVPIIVVIMMYKFNWMPNGASVGDLVRPARLLSTIDELKLNDGKPLPSEFWKQKWSVVYIAGDCQIDCLARLHDMRQLYVSLYKDMPRVQRVLITNTQDVSHIKLDYPDLIIINQPSESLVNFSKQFNVRQENVFTGNRLYLVDPVGHFMMSYQSQVPLSAIRKDITRLLRFSWAG
ncbi:MAG: hypothetical protein HOO90_09790 [Methylotenera sp.]|uniref:hypothetical protein n=1 Tax=Methylotenera sp. TaxID=2051956 RepID=UPI00185580CA|nr:hypothetical protein [Methylotenera sp.]NOU25813.1 hypothetical protein [Methylotenera sp.]